jgi:hypothetical protein
MSEESIRWLEKDLKILKRLQDTISCRIDDLANREANAFLASGGDIDDEYQAKIGRLVGQSTKIFDQTQDILDKLKQLSKTRCSP